MAKKSVSRMLVKALLILVCGYLAIMLLVYLLQSRLVFFPTREITERPTDMGMDYEDLALQSGDGVKLSAWFIPAAISRGTILVCHGNGGNIGHRVELARVLHDLGWNVLLVDYRGYGLSEGRPSEAGLYQDAQAAWDYLVETRGIAPGRIVIHGRSLGGAVAAHLAAGRAPAGLILESTFTSLPDVAAKHYRLLPVRWLCRYRFATVDKLPEITCPVLVVHSPEDDIVPYDLGRGLFDAAGSDKRFLEISGDHNTGFLTSGRTYSDGLRNYLEAVEAATSPRPSGD